MLKSRDFLCKLTQSVKTIGNFFFELEKKNLLTAAKAPLCSAGSIQQNIAPREGHTENQLFQYKPTSAHWLDLVVRVLLHPFSKH